MDHAPSVLYVSGSLWFSLSGKPHHLLRMSPSINPSVSHTDRCLMIILWWTCFSSQNKCWHRAGSRFPKARLLIPNFNHIGSCLPAHPASGSTPTSPPTARSGDRRARYSQGGPLNTPPGKKAWNIYWQHANGRGTQAETSVKVHLTPMVDTAASASPLICPGGRFICTNPSSPKRSSCSQRESDT